MFVIVGNDFLKTNSSYIFLLRYVDCEDPLLEFILTYKFSQDHLELFFGVIRRKGGLNDNPTAQQFEGAYKRILLHGDLTAPVTGNCVAQDDTEGLFVSPNQKKKSNLMPILQEEYDENFEDYETILTDLDNTQKDVASYMSGAVIRAVRRKIKCESCVQALLNEGFDNSFTTLIDLKNQGGLLYPSEDLKSLCFTAEAVFRTAEQQKRLNQDHIKQTLIDSTLQNIPIIFQIQHEDVEIDSQEHSNQLKSIVLNWFFNAKLHHLTRKIVENVKKGGKRNKIRKVMHNQGI
jgi:hypothetical protein